MFEVGDRIVIRDWDDMAEEYVVDDDGDIRISEYDTYFTENMMRLCGAHGIIESIADDEWISIRLDDQELNDFAERYNFYPPMFRLEDDIVDIEISESDFDSLLGV